MDCQSTIEFAQIVVRGVLLALVSVGGMVSIYFGWRLYQSAILSQVEGEFSTQSLKFKLSAASPGVFLAAFGAYLLLSVSQHRWHEQEVHEAIAKPSAWSSKLLSGFHRTDYRPEQPVQQSCSCPPKQECLLAKTTKVKDWMGGANDVTTHSLKEDLSAIRSVLEGISPNGSTERLRLVKATQALARLEAAAIEAAEDSRK